MCEGWEMLDKNEKKKPDHDHKRKKKRRKAKGMAHNVNVFFSNWTNTGQKVPVDKWTADFTIQWIDDTGPREWTGVITFPNDLAQVPASWLKQELLDLVMRAARKRLGIDPEETP